MPPALIDQPSRGVAKWPTVAVAVSSSARTRTPPNTMSVDMPPTEPLTCQVGGSLPSQVAGKPVGPTGGDRPQAWAVSARAAAMAATTAAQRTTRMRLPCQIARPVAARRGPRIRATMRRCAPRGSRRSGRPSRSSRSATVPNPEPGAGEVRVRVHVSAVNPGDTKKRAGAFGPPAFPLIVPHSDGAGVIDRVGAGIDPGRVGERVWLFNAQSGRPFGTAADLCVVPAEAAVRLPDDVDFVTGAALGIPARTAHRAVFCAGPVAGKTVLVAGGAGGVGRYAVELARWGRADVLATVGGEAQARIALAAGARRAIDYKREDVAAIVVAETGGRGADHVVEVDLARNAALDARALAMGGTIAAFATSDPTPVLPFWPLVFRAATLICVGVDSDPAHQTDALADLDACLAAGLLRPTVAEVVPLGRIADAHALVERGAAGKVFVEIAG